MPGLEVYIPTAQPLVSVATLVGRVRTKLFESSPWQDKLTSAYTAGSTSISTANPGMWSEGQVAEVDDGSGAQFRINSFDPISNPITIQAGYNGTSDANHANGAVLLQNPEFTYDTVQEAVTRVTLSENWNWAYVVQNTQITPSPSTTTLYAVPQDFIALVGATQLDTGTITRVWSYPQDGCAILTVPNIGTATIGTTMAFSFPGGFYNTTNVVDIYYAARITTTSIPDGDIAEYIAYRAAERLLGFKEVPLTAQNQAMPAPPPGAVPGARLRSSLWAKGEADSLKRSIRAQMGTVAPLARNWIA